jgi:chemotaxis protein histidine kinase CheA
MRFRVEAEGGTLTVTSAPGLGTLIKVRLPERVLEATSPPLEWIQVSSDSEGAAMPVATLGVVT